MVLAALLLMGLVVLVEVLSVVVLVEVLLMGLVVLMEVLSVMVLVVGNSTPGTVD